METRRKRDRDTSCQGRKPHMETGSQVRRACSARVAPRRSPISRCSPARRATPPGTRPPPRSTSDRSTTRNGAPDPSARRCETDLREREREREREIQYLSAMISGAFPKERARKAKNKTEKNPAGTRGRSRRGAPRPSRCAARETTLDKKDLEHPSLCPCRSQETAANSQAHADGDEAALRSAATHVLCLNR